MSLVADKSREGQRQEDYLFAKKRVDLNLSHRKGRFISEKNWGLGNMQIERKEQVNGKIKIQECVSGTTSRSNRVNWKRGGKDQGEEFKLRKE